MGSTWEALRRAEHERNEAVATRQAALDQLTEDVAALRVTVHALEDRVELELGGLSDDLRQAIAKAEDLAASRARGAEERLIHRLGWLTESAARGERRLNAIAAGVGLVALLALFRC